MEKIIYTIISIAIVVCFSISFLKSCKNHQDISGTVIAKSESIKSRYKSTVVYTECILSIHPDDNRLSDFDIEVPLHSYVKYGIGDKVVFHNERITKYIKDLKWYDDEDVWFGISIILIATVAIYLLWVCIVDNICK